MGNENPSIRKSDRALPPGEPLRVPGVGRLPEGQGRKIRYTLIEGEPPEELLLCRVEGRLYALDTLCPHEGGRIAEGPLMGGRHAICPLHLYKFDPRDGRALDVECPSTRTFRVEEVNGFAEIWVHAPESETEET